MRILFMGTPDFAVPCLQALLDEKYNVVGVVTQPDRPKGRKQILTPSPVKELALQYNLPIFQPEKVSNPEEINKLRCLSIDLIVTAAFGQLLSKELLQLPRLGCINVHASLLPKYRGGAPIHWSVINGEQETGVTIMYMVEKLDAGPMISQKKVPIAFDDTTGVVYEKVTKAGAELLLETLPSIVEGTVQAIEQDETKATFASNIRRSDEIIQWDRSALSIYNQIRGLAPWPGAYTTYEEQIIKIWSSEIYKPEQKVVNQYKPGEVFENTKDGPVIATGEGFLLLRELQPAGKKLISGTDYVNSGKISAGEFLGT